MDTMETVMTTLARNVMKHAHNAQVQIQTNSKDAMKDGYYRRPHVILDVLRVNIYQPRNVSHVMIIVQNVLVRHNAQLAKLVISIMMEIVLKNAQLPNMLIKSQVTVKLVLLHVPHAQVHKPHNA